VSSDQPPLLLSWPRENVALVTLNRPDRLNALTLDLVDGIRRTILDLGADPRCRAIVLTGSGRGFCAGLDIGGYLTRDPSTMRGPGARLNNQERFAGMVRAMREIRQPVIAAVNGPAAGGGFGLALGADVRVASESARFHVAAVKIGLSAGECGISYHLPRYVGAARAFEIFLTGRPIDAAEAERIGLVTRVVPDELVVDAALELADAICSNSPFSIWMTKKVMWANLDADFDAAIELENRTQILAALTADSQEAMRAFVEKRSPVFAGE
jgi:enoyl-CoA hydratase